MTTHSAHAPRAAPGRSSGDEPSANVGSQHKAAAASMTHASTVRGEATRSIRLKSGPMNLAPGMYVSPYTRPMPKSALVPKPYTVSAMKNSPV